MHYAITVVHILDKKHSHRSVRRGGPITWLARFPELIHVTSPLGFFESSGISRAGPK